MTDKDETTEAIGLEALGLKPTDTVSFRITGVDRDAGTITVSQAHEWKVPDYLCIQINFAEGKQ